MKPNKYLTNLTPLRGIAALATVVFHIDIVLSVFGGYLLNSKISSLINRMYLMVDFFFVLSGFILCYVYADNFEGAVKKQSFKKFTIARFARVYPLHLFSLLLTTLFLFLLHRAGMQVSPILDAENSIYSFCTNLLLLHSMNLHKWFTFTHASWSISTEWWMYMLFPFLVSPFMKLSAPGRRMIFIFCMAGYLVIGYLLVPLVTVPDAQFIRVLPFSLNVAYQFGFFRCLIGFTIGMIVYFGYKEDWGRRFFSSLYTFPSLVITLILCLHFAVFDLLTVLLFPCMLLSAAYGNRQLDKILSSKPLQKLGDWSFSLYLIHQPFLYQLTALMANPKKTGVIIPKMGLLLSWSVCFVFILFILFISSLSFRFIEGPARHFINGHLGKQKENGIKN